jgi:uncharacterized membrane protein
VDSTPVLPAVVADPRHLLWTRVMYGLHGLSLAIGAVTTLLGYRTLLFGVPSLAAVGLNLIRRTGVRGTWLATHFSWQLRTCGWALAWLAAVTLAFGSIVLVFTRLPLLEIGYLLVAAWTGWRLWRGWLALRDGRAIAAETD